LFSFLFFQERKAKKVMTATAMIMGDQSNKKRHPAKAEWRPDHPIPSESKTLPNPYTNKKIAPQQLFKRFSVVWNFRKLKFHTIN